MKTLAIVLTFFIYLAPAQAQIDHVKSLLNEHKSSEAIQLIDAIEEPLSAELQHLKALAILNMGDEAASDYFGLDPYPDDLSPDEQSQAVQQFVDSHILPLVADAVQRGHTPAKIDLALLLSIGDDSISQTSLNLFVEAADEGYLPAELLLFSFFCSGEDEGRLGGERYSPIRMLNRIDTIESDADDEPNYYHISGNVDDDELLLRIIGNAAVSFAVGTCSEVNEQVAEAAFDKLIQRPGGREAAAASFRALLDHIEEDALWRPDARNTINPDPALAKRWKQFGLSRQLLSILSAVDLFDQSVNGGLVQHHAQLTRATLDEIIRLTELEQKKDFSVWESALMSLFSHAESAAESKRFSQQTGYSAVIQDAMIFAADELNSEYPSYWRYESIADKFASGEAWPKDLAKAVHFYEKAAAIDDPFGSTAFSLGWHYSDVENTFADGGLAVGWYASAFEKGQVGAAYNNGLIFEFGKAIDSSDKNALFWYQKAAEAGDADGMLKVGIFYDLGKGVPENDTTAYNWYLKAAELGNVGAQYNVGMLLMIGEGVPVDLTQAYKWLNLAQANGAENARDMKNRVAQNMSRVQIQEAQRLSASWTPKASADEVESATLRTATSTSPPRGYDPSIVRTIQEGLSELDYYQGDVDGIYGPMTAAAIRRFQSDLEMEINTTPSSDLALQIGSVLGMKFVLDEESEGESSNIRPQGSGSGFIVSDNGQVVTNAHVVAGCSSIEVQGAESAYIEDTDDFVDLALIRANFSRRKKPLTLRSGRGIRLGDSILVAGYPLSNILGNSVRITTGSVSSLSGIGGDRITYQISAPIQPGNSGGPVLDGNGNIVGVVVSKLDAMSVASQIGDIPQNVNFAISLGMLKSFLDANGVDYPISRDEQGKTTTQIAKVAEPSTVQILCN
jgi:TPR repeat protein